MTNHKLDALLWQHNRATPLARYIYTGKVHRLSRAPGSNVHRLQMACGLAPLKSALDFEDVEGVRCQQCFRDTGKPAHSRQEMR